MRVPRALAGALLWIVSGVIALVAVIPCLTIILLPVGIPLLKVGTRMFGQAMRLFMPPELSRPVKRPVKHGRKPVKKAWKKGRRAVA